MSTRIGSEAGFTLIEVMVVVLIIGILLSVGIPTFVGARNRAYDVAALSHLDVAAKAALISSDGGDLGTATATALALAEPSMTFVDGSVASTASSEASVDASGDDRWVAVVRSGSDRCLAIEIRPTGRTLFEAASCAAGLVVSPTGTPTSSPTTTTAPTTTAPTTTAPTTTAPTTTAPTTTAASTTAAPTTAAPTTAAPTTAAPTATMPACSTVAIDSFQQASYSFNLQIRNTTSSALAFEVVIPDTNYQLTNLQFNGSGQNMSYTNSANGDGTFDITVSGTLPAYQSVGGQQPNGFNGQITPTSGQPFIRCQST